MLGFGDGGLDLRSADGERSKGHVRLSEIDNIAVTGLRLVGAFRRSVVEYVVRAAQAG